MIRLSLSQRLSVVFCGLLLVCCGALAMMQMRASVMHEQEVVQRLSRGLAEHIAQSGELMDRDGLRPANVRDLFGKLMAVNPSVEVYLLDDRGRILGHDAAEGHLRRKQVDVAPIQQLLRGDRLPILGDDPRSAHGRKVFNAAPLRVQGRDVGYIYVVLLGEERDALVADVTASAALRTTLWSVSLVAVLGLLAGIAAFRWVTRPLRRLTARMQAFDVEGRAPRAPDDRQPPLAPGEKDEIAILEHSFSHMSRRIGEQWQELSRQDQQRRELVANISHDLRTPLSSLHGYLETLALKDGTLDPAERRRYLEIALGQSRKVGRLVQELFELARLEYGAVQLDRQAFSLPDLVQDVFQKFELAAEARRQVLVADIPPGVPAVVADIGLVERVLTNLIDNAIRHTPGGGRIELALRTGARGVVVTVADDGPGIPAELRRRLFETPSVLASGDRADGGLGLMIVRQILQLHGSGIELVEDGRGAVFRFELPTTTRPLEGS